MRPEGGLESIFIIIAKWNCNNIQMFSILLKVFSCLFLIYFDFSSGVVGLELTISYLNPYNARIYVFM